jgi:hypothetical protein
MLKTRHDVYRGRRSVLAARHGKERAVSRAFSAALGVDLAVPANLDPDCFGNVLKEALPEERQSRFLPFMLGGASYAGLLIFAG